MNDLLALPLVFTSSLLDSSLKCDRRRGFLEIGCNVMILQIILSTESCVTSLVTNTANITDECGG